MSRSNHRSPDALTPALTAIGELLMDGFANLASSSWSQGLMAHSEIERVAIPQKNSTFHRYLLPLRKEMVALLTDTYRRYFKLGLAHRSKTGNDPDSWAQGQLWSAVLETVGWMRDWYVLACDGENQWIRHVASLPFVPGGTVSAQISNTVEPFPSPACWRAPAWLFQISPLLGFRPLKTKHVPSTDSEEKLGEGHTRLLLSGARRSLLWQLSAAIVTVRNEEIAAAGAVPTDNVAAPSTGGKRQRGVEGLQKKTDLSQYSHGLTEKQQLAFSLKYEYELGLAEIASRMEIDRKTAYGHIQAATKKSEHARSNEKRKRNSAKGESE
jgi:Putative helix-turn-helix protein, YlxM / p13 like